MTLFPDLDVLCAYMGWSGRDDVRTFWKTFGKQEKAIEAVRTTAITNPPSATAPAPLSDH